MSVSMVTGREFATKFALQPDNFAWFLGAGASAAGRIPTGYAMIRDFKTELFCREAGVPRQEVDATDPLWMSRIDLHFQTNASLPPPGDPLEYARAFELVYPNRADRRLYIDRQVQQGQPSFAHRVLASLLVTRRAPCVFTTNFDNLVETATTVARELLPPPERATLTVGAVDDAERASRCLRENDWPLLVKIHGDFKSEELKNTETELQTQDAKLRKVLIETCRRFALIVVGYSGRDQSIMEALQEAASQAGAFPGGIYWVTRDPSDLLPVVSQFLEDSAAHGVLTNIIQSQTFDEFAGDLVETVRFTDALTDHIRSAEPEPTLRLVSLPTHEARRDPVLRLSAVRLFSLPTVARRLELGIAAEISEIRAKLKEHKARAMLAKAGTHWAAFGSDADLLNALGEFQPTLNGTIDLDPSRESWAMGLVYDALARALCNRRPLRHRLKRSGHSVLVSSGSLNETPEHRARRIKELGPLKYAYGAELYGKVKDLGFPFAEALQLRLEEIDGAWWCVFDPYTQVDLPPDPQDDGQVDKPFQWKPNPAADWIREQWARRYNKSWSAIIDAWSSILSGQVRAFWIESGQGIDANFEVGAVTGWSVPSHDHPYFHRQSR